MSSGPSGIDSIGGKIMTGSVESSFIPIFISSLSVILFLLDDSRLWRDRRHSLTRRTSKRTPLDKLIVPPSSSESPHTCSSLRDFTNIFGRPQWQIFESYSEESERFSIYWSRRWSWLGWACASGPTMAWMITRLCYFGQRTSKRLAEA